MKNVKGEVIIGKWSPTQVLLTVSNIEHKIEVAVPLTDDAVDELITVLQRIRKGDFDSGMIQLDAIGNPIDYQGVRAATDCPSAGQRSEK